MRILSNDYYSSTPQATEKIQGGPRRFSADFSQYLRSAGHQWIGLIRSYAHIDTLYRELPTADDQRFFEISTPKVTLEGLRELTAYSTPHEYLHSEIQTLRSLFEHVDPDLLFLNGFSAYSWLLFAGAKECGIPVVIQHAGIMKYEVGQYEDMFSQFGARCVSKWKKMLHVARVPMYI